MTIAIIGANGQIGRILAGQLVAAGHTVRGLIRDEAQADNLEAVGAEPVIGNLEGEFAHVLDGCDAAVFTAGSGGKTGGDKTLLIDLWGGVRSFEACKSKGVQRYLMVSALKSDDPQSGPERLRHYLVAKRIADEYLERSGLDYTICRPGLLLNEPGTGLIDVSHQSGNPDVSVSREDVAAVLTACLTAPNSIGKTFDLGRGTVEITEAVTGL